MKSRLIALFLVAAAASAAMSCHKKDEASAAPPAGGKAGGKGRGALTFTVDVLPIEAKKVEYIVLAPGTIDAFERVQVTARVAGVVDRVLFTEGQQVKKGKALVVIDAERYSLSVAQAKASLEKAKALQSDAESQIARREAATADHPGLITGEEIATIRTKVVTAKADSDVAAQAVRTAQVNLRDSTVSAPIEGVIQTRTIETGQYVQAGYVMATLLRSDPMLLHFQVEPDDAPRLKAGMIATFRMRETDRTFSAKISLVSGAADLVTHMIGVTAEVTETEHKFWLRPGSFCDVSVNVGASRDAPLIPRSAARATDHGYVAYVIENDVAKERPLNLGMSTKDGWVEVRSGLKAGEMLVVRGAEPLANGSHVKANKVTPDSLKADAPLPSASAAPPAADPPDSAAAAPAPPPDHSAHGAGGRRGGKAPQ